MRPLTCLCLVAALGSGLATYRVKDRSDSLERQTASVLAQAARQRQRIATNRALWQWMPEEATTPQAVAAMGLAPLRPDQVLADEHSLVQALPPPVSGSLDAPEPASFPAALSAAAARPEPAAAVSPPLQETALPLSGPAKSVRTASLRLAAVKVRHTTPAAPLTPAPALPSPTWPTNLEVSMLPVTQGGSALGMSRSTLVLPPPVPVGALYAVAR